MTNKNIMRKVKRISRSEADKIILDWHNQGRQFKKIVLCFSGVWYDTRQLDEQEILAFMSELTGQKVKPEDIKELQINP